MIRRTAFALCLVAAPAAANPPLAEQAEISEGLIAAAIAYEIGDKCDSLDARLLRGIAFLNGLRSRASDLGYSDAEIDAYMDDRAEKRRLEAVARQRLRDLGGVEGDWDSYCAVGRDQMAAGSQIGQLLR
jgi:hypothetical protein